MVPRSLRSSHALEDPGQSSINQRGSIEVPRSLRSSHVVGDPGQGLLKGIQSGRMKQEAHLEPAARPQAAPTTCEDNERRGQSRRGGDRVKGQVRGTKEGGWTQG